LDAQPEMIKASKQNIQMCFRFTITFKPEWS
jgi:hypothetical protein